MKKTFFSFFTALISLSILVLLSSCISLNFGTKKTTSSLKTSTLSNNIPVFLRDHSGVSVSVNLIIEGGVSLLSENLAGLEDFTINLMLKGSKNYTEEQIQEIKSRSNFEINYKTQRDYSVIELKCLVKDFEEIFALFADKILNPTFDENEFNELKTETIEKLKKKKLTPMGVLSSNLRKTVYRNHPYSVSPTLTELSAENITLSNIKDWHSKILNSNRMKIVAVGNFSAGKDEILLGEFEKHLVLTGKITPKGENFQTFPNFSFDANPKMLQNKCEDAKDDFYAVAYFNAPNRYDPSYPSYVITGMIIDDLLFENTKIKHKAVQSVGTGILSGKELVGIISVIKTTDSEDFTKLIDEAIQDFPDEKILNKELNQYKKKYITSIYEKNKDISAIAENIITSVEYSGNPEKYLARPDEIEAITVKDVLNAYNTYFDNKTNPRKWIVAGAKPFI